MLKPSAHPASDNKTQLFIQHLSLISTPSTIKTNHQSLSSLDSIKFQKKKLNTKLQTIPIIIKIFTSRKQKTYLIIASPYKFLMQLKIAECKQTKESTPRVGCLESSRRNNVEKNK